MKHLTRTLSAILFSLTLSAPGLAHEFWISPTTYVIPSGGQVQADLRVGENLEGPSYSFRPRSFERFEVITASGAIPVEGKLGDVPAMDMASLPDGLSIIVHETTDNRLRYAKWEKFKKFVNGKDLKGVLASHQKRGIRNKNFTELYRRFAKSLVAVGDGQGADQRVGLRTEIVALDNPYTSALSEIRVEVLKDGSPRSDAQIELFERAPNGTVDVTFHRTDTNGIGRFPVKPGYEYLVDAVAMEPLENDDPDDGAVWISLWAALTFLVPEQPL